MWNMRQIFEWLCFSARFIWSACLQSLSVMCLPYIYTSITVHPEDERRYTPECMTWSKKKLCLASGFKTSILCMSFKLAVTLIHILLDAICLGTHHWHQEKLYLKPKLKMFLCTSLKIINTVLKNYKRSWNKLSEKLKIGIKVLEF